jgi:RNA polymerase sigma factor (TIGR02999 family)
LDSNLDVNAAQRRETLDHIFSLTYEELRRLASTVRRGDPSQTINTTALVHEAWMKLARSPEFASTSVLHFKRIAARAMRQVLVEAARRRKAEKRGREVLLTTFGDADAAVSYEAEVLHLHEALERLARLNARQAQVVEGRFFGGLEIPETAELLGVSEATVLRDWRAAKAWLARELRSGDEGSVPSSPRKP